MFRNYFKIAVRNLRRSKAFTAINVAGLALGIATCLLIVLYIQYELSYDRWNEKSDRIVRVSLHGKMQVGELTEASVMAPVAATLQKDFPEIEEATRILGGGSPRITYGDKTFKEDALALVDSNFFSVFSIPLLKGDAHTALVKPYSVVISSAVAKRYFGNDEWGFAFYTYSHDKYELSMYDDGQFTGKPEHAFRISANVYLNE